GRPHGHLRRSRRTGGVDAQGVEPRHICQWSLARRRLGSDAETGVLRHARCPRTQVKSEGRSEKGEVGAHPQQAIAIVALGSNLGDSRASVLYAMERLQELSDQPLVKSSLYETAPVDCPPGSPVFVNAIVGFMPRRDETPESLLAKLQTLE